MIEFSWGELQIRVLDAGSLWLDGGAMFGVVPKALWARQRSADDRNRIRLGMNVLLVDDGKRKVLLDTGAGSKWDEKGRAIYGIESKSAAELLAPAGLRPEAIDLVVNSHLHFDHAGGNTDFDAGGTPKPAFPRAEYVVQRGELATARWRNERTSGSYLPADFEPLVAEGRFHLVEGDVVLDRHLRLMLAPGHTPFMQIICIVAGGRTLAFLADLVPTASHVAYPYVMGYDLEPLATLATKKRLLPRAAAEGWRLVFEHDAEMPLGTLAERDGRLVAIPVAEA